MAERAVRRMMLKFGEFMQTDSQPSSVGGPFPAEGEPWKSSRHRPLALTGIQLSLHQALAQRSVRLADIYLGALYALRAPGNPERFSQAALSLRELVQHLWTEYDERFKKKDRGLKPRVQELQSRYRPLRYKNGAIVRPSDLPQEKLEQLFRELDAFFEWSDAVAPRRKEQYSRALTKMDPMGRPLPEIVMERHAEQLDQLVTYFNAVVHHGNQPSNDVEFRDRLEALERFLIERLQPQTGADFDQLDRLIQEGEEHA